MPLTPFNSTAYRWRRWLFICAVAVQLLVASASIFLLSTVRIVVGGESLWTKGMYTAVMSLQRYAVTGAPQDYLDFEQAMATPLGIGTARQALDAPARDHDALHQGLLRAQLHPDDADAIAYMLPWIWDWPQLQASRQLWRQADAHVLSLQQMGQSILQRRSAGPAVTPSEEQGWLQSIAQIRSTTIPLARQFSALLGEHSRTLSSILLLINIITAVVLSLLYWFSVQRAVKDGNQAQLTLEAERQRSSITLAALADGVLSLDSHQRIRYANPAASHLLDTPIGHLLGRHIGEVLPVAPALIAQHAQTATRPVAEPSASQKERSIHWLEREGKPKVAVRISVTEMQAAAQDATSGTVLVLHDVSQEQSYMRMLVWQQNHDLLTGLDNRAAFEKHLQQAQGRHHASLLHLNLDHFKMINASYGHAAGDEILRQVTQQLRLALREDDVLARIGGDEFAVMLNHCHPHAAMQTAERLRKIVHGLHVQWRQHNLHTGVSIGVVHLDPEQKYEAQALLAMASSACKHAKESGRNRISVYSPHNRAFHRYQGDMEWVQRLRSSLEKDQFMLMAQTVYPLKPHGNEMEGAHFEVLLRLRDGPDKLIYPSEFIPIAERYDLMPQIDRWVVRHALKQLRQLITDGAHISTCSINLSGAGLGDHELLEFIRHHIFEQEVVAEKLCFEITETSAIANMDSAISMIEELRQLGCRFSLDDFGSGMASFKYLQSLPVDYLKIDGSFVQNMMQNPYNRAMVESIHHIGDVMGKQTIAEFVGDAVTLDALQAMGVDYAQGYYIGPPAPFDATFFSTPPRILLDKAANGSA